MHHGGNGIPMFTDEGPEAAKSKKLIDFATGKPFDYDKALARLTKVFSGIFDLAKAKRLPNSSPMVQFPDNDKCAEMLLDVQNQFRNYLKTKQDTSLPAGLFSLPVKTGDDEEISKLLEQADTTAMLTNDASNTNAPSFEEFLSELGLPVEETMKIANASSLSPDSVDIDALLESVDDASYSMETETDKASDFLQASHGIRRL